MISIFVIISFEQQKNIAFINALFFRSKSMHTCLLCLIKNIFRLICFFVDLYAKQCFYQLHFRKKCIST